MTPFAASTFVQSVFAAMLVVPIVILWIAAVFDVFRHGYTGLKIAALLVLILIVPIIGPLLYFVFRRPDPSTAEDVRLAQEDRRREAARRPVGGTGVYR
jgi:hypothetical protein